MLDAAARGDFPPADGGVDFLPAPPGPVDAVVAFTAHHYVAAPVAPAEAGTRLDPDDIGSPMKPAFLAWLGARLGAAPGMLDVLLVAAGRPDASGDGHTALEHRPDLADHPRARRAVQYRTDVAVYADPSSRGVVVVGRGLAGRREVAFEVAPERRRRGLGTALAAAALALVPAGEFLYAQASPGNVASLRALLAAGYRPIGGEVLYLRSAG